MERLYRLRAMLHGAASPPLKASTGSAPLEPLWMFGRRYSDDPTAPPSCLPLEKVRTIIFF